MLIGKFVFSRVFIAVCSDGIVKEISLSYAYSYLGLQDGDLMATCHQLTSVQGQVATITSKLQYVLVILGSNLVSSTL